MSPVISKRTARSLIATLVQLKNHPEDYSAELKDLRASVETKKFVRASRIHKTAKRQTKKEETAAIREAVMKRADGGCEFCGSPETKFQPLHLDHFFGRKHQRQTERNCWALCYGCHFAKTNNDPDAHTWLHAFAEHAQRCGYPSEEKQALARIDFVEARASLSRGGPGQ